MGALKAAPTMDALTAQVETELRDIVGSREMDLYRMMSYHLGWEHDDGSPRDSGDARRTHGVACLTACHAVGGDLEMALPAAASVELVSSFCEIHDDVQGGHPQREDRPSVWWKWGPAQAINAGDAMHALARLAIFRLQDRGVSAEVTSRAVRMVDQASLELCEGRFRDLEAQERIALSVEAYLETASSKTGALYACAMGLGGLVSDADDAATDALAECGARLGLAMQIRDDLRALWPDEGNDAPPNPDMLNKKKMLPVVYAVENGVPGQKRRLGELYLKRVLDPEDVPAVRGVLEEVGAKEHSETLMAQYRAEAEAAVAIPQISQEGAAAVSVLVEAALGE